MKKFIALVLLFVMAFTVATGETTYPFGIKDDMNMEQVAETVQPIFGEYSEEGLLAIGDYFFKSENLYFWDFSMNGVTVAFDRYGWKFVMHLIDEQSDIPSESIAKLYSRLTDLYGEPEQVTPEVWNIDMDGNKTPKPMLADPKAMEASISKYGRTTFEADWDRVTLSVEFDGNVSYISHTITLTFFKASLRDRK